MTGPAVVKASKKLARIHWQLQKAQAEFNEAVQARYGLTVNDAADQDLGLIQISDYGMDCNLSELDDEMIQNGYEVRRWKNV